MKRILKPGDIVLRREPTDNHVSVYILQSMDETLASVQHYKFGLKYPISELQHIDDAVPLAAPAAQP